MSKKRALFEEVGEDAPRAEAPAPGAAEAARRGDRTAIARWLLVLAGLVVLMVLVGGLTRLTDSGLSITEWRPVTGAVPPMSDSDWQAEFEKYKTIPQYELLNRGMTLGEFKTIYWWEWGHRQLGRLVGLVWAAGFRGLSARQKSPAGWTGRLLLPGVLGGLQGAIGWWMVASGLEGRMVAVASYRLAVHLGLAFVILGVLLHYVWLLRRDGAELLQARRRRLRGLRRFGQVFAGLLFVQILLGALVAGIDAGRGYIDWPLMGGEVLPSESFDYEPFWSNFFENPALVQFNHRALGYVVFLVGLAWWWKCRGGAHAGLRRRADWVAVMLFGQMVIGVVTVLHAAPLHWAILHQAGALILWALTLRAVFEAGWPGEERIARA